MCKSTFIHTTCHVRLPRNNLACSPLKLCHQNFGYSAGIHLKKKSLLLLENSLVPFNNNIVSLQCFFIWLSLLRWFLNLSFVELLCKWFEFSGEITLCAVQLWVFFSFVAKAAKRCAVEVSYMCGVKSDSVSCVPPPLSGSVDRSLKSIWNHCAFCSNLYWVVCSCWSGIVREMAV